VVMVFLSCDSTAPRWRLDGLWLIGEGVGRCCGN